MLIARSKSKSRQVDHSEKESDENRSGSLRFRSGIRLLRINISCTAGQS